MSDAPEPDALARAPAEPPGFVTAMRVPPGATLTTFTIFHYPRGAWLWALRQMGAARRELAATPGLGFHHLLGSGAGLGFSRVPDLSRYALLATWSSEQAADDFFAASPLLARWHRTSATDRRTGEASRKLAGLSNAPRIFLPGSY